MKRSIYIFFKLIQKFGFFTGSRLYLQFKAKNVEKVKIPSLKNSLSLRSNSSDIPTFYQVFLFDEYNIKFPKPPKIIIDGGANVGFFSIKMKNDYPQTKIICIEPDPDNFSMLQKNVQNYADVYLENSGLWMKDTKLKVYDKFNFGKWGMVVEEDLIAGNIDAISIGSLLKKHSIDYIDILKLDIETSEKQLFSENYESWLPKVKTIIIELHDWIELGCSKPFFKAINNSFNNYSFSHVGENVIITNEDI